MAKAASASLHGGHDLTQHALQGTVLEVRVNVASGVPNDRERRDSLGTGPMPGPCSLFLGWPAYSSSSAVKEAPDGSPDYSDVDAALARMTKEVPEAVAKALRAVLLGLAEVGVGPEEMAEEAEAAMVQHIMRA